MSFRQTLTLIISLSTVLFCYSQPSSLHFNHLNVNNGLSQGVNHFAIPGNLFIKTIPDQYRLDSFEKKEARDVRTLLFDKK
jgi:hypothetical protein